MQQDHNKQTVAASLNFSLIFPPKYPLISHSLRVPVPVSCPHSAITTFPQETARCLHGQRKPLPGGVGI